MANRKPFESAEFYDCDDGREQLVDSTPEEAIHRHFDELFMGDDDTLAERIEDECPLTVHGFTRTEVDLTIYADRLADALEEAISEDEELNEGSELPVAIKWDRAELVKAIEDAIRPFGAKVEPWCCEQTSKREYSADEVRGILPASWFAEAANAKR